MDFILRTFVIILEKSFTFLCFLSTFLKMFLVSTGKALKFSYFCMKGMLWVFIISASWSGPSCSKLTMSLVNNLLKFTSSDTQIC